MYENREEWRTSYRSTDETVAGIVLVVVLALVVCGLAIVGGFLP